MLGGLFVSSDVQAYVMNAVKKDELSLENLVRTSNANVIDGSCVCRT